MKNDDMREIDTGTFPQLLEIPEPPRRLFVRGELPDADSALLTVVGSRKHSHYGRDICEELIAGLSGYDIVIVSGLAMGIDTIAHKAALAAGLRTIAVPGSGLSDGVLYPRTNLPLARRIIEAGGALLSEFDPDFRATVWSFPQRNRIMAGISHMTLVIEAEERSGTLITARLALDYNRTVCAVPGSVFSQNSRGTNKLLRQGATPITSSDDILEELGFGRKDDAIRDERTFNDCSPEEKRVLEIIGEPRARDELIRSLELPTSQANILLSAMEIKGLIKESGGMMRRG